METKYREANATFKFTIGNFQGEKTIRSKTVLAKAIDDWKVNLAVQAAEQISRSNNTGLKDISLQLKYFEVRV